MFRARTQDCDALVRILLSDAEILTLNSLELDHKALAAEVSKRWDFTHTRARDPDQIGLGRGSFVETSTSTSSALRS